MSDEKHAIDNSNCTALSYQGLNIANTCKRDLAEASIMFISYILVTVIAVISNASVILASIFERWKEIDQFTFVMAVSQAFCHLLLAFFVYPMGAFSMFAGGKWGAETPGKLWCWQTAILTSYFEVMYLLHIMMLASDILIGRFTKLKNNVFVALSKRVALSLWVVAIVPQAYVFINVDKDHKLFGYDDETETCNASYLYITWGDFFEYVGVFIVAPVAYCVTYYIVLLYQHKKSNGNAKLKANTKPNSGRSFWMNYRTSFVMITLYAISQLPRWIYVFITIAMSEKQLKHDEAEGEKLEYMDIRIADFVVLWSSVGSIFIPIGYLVTCPTYFQQVTRFTWMAWLRRLQHVIHPDNKTRHLFGSLKRLRTISRRASRKSGFSVGRSSEPATASGEAGNVEPGSGSEEYLAPVVNVTSAV